ncbi:MAG: Gfo/Idh/MocA family oxidoreductase [Verrucomicrobia bacterium]|nr:Gfo/Idh/MocA family oxidoreductase [Verrucomicrobiota bacterium]
MNQSNAQSAPAPVTRREFLKTSSLVTATTVAAVNFPAVVRAQAKQPLNAVIIGLGGRGSGAGRDFLEAAKEVGVEGKIVAVADVFPEQALSGTKNFGLAEAKCFSGFDAYMKALEIPGVNYAIIATPPGFKPSQFKACIEAGKHVFTEKPVAVDGPGCRIMYEAGELAKKKNLKVAAGTQRRHRPSYIETVKRIQDGTIGDLITLRAYWVNGGPIWHRAEQEARSKSDLERQIRNWYHYIWLSGDHICEQEVHNLDVCNWIAGDHPVKCWGMGARQQLGDKSGEIWDNFAVEYEYANGVRMYSYCGQIKRGWSSVSEAVLGTKGTAELYDGRNILKPKGGAAWRPTGLKNDNGYVNEHIDLMNAIAKDTELNETKNVTDSTLTAIMGREAAYSGAGVEWDAIAKSKFAYGPEQVYVDSSKLQFGPFRTLRPPMPSLHDILREPPMLPVAA